MRLTTRRSANNQKKKRSNCMTAVMSRPTSWSNTVRLKLATIALVATTLHALPAQAYPVQIYGPEPKFADEVSRYYDEAPKALRDKVGKPWVMVFKTAATMAVLWQSWGLLPPQIAGEYARSQGLLGIARYTPENEHRTYIGIIQSKGETTEEELSV
jgi:hypothetical protein